jgi:hypothetical protein
MTAYPAHIIAWGREMVAARPDLRESLEDLIKTGEIIEVDGNESNSKKAM